MFLLYMMLWVIGTGKGGHYERGLFTGRISRISQTLESLENGWIVLCFPQSVSRKWIFLKRPLFQKTPSSDPELRLKDPSNWTGPWAPPGAQVPPQFAKTVHAETITELILESWKGHLFTGINLGVQTPILFV